MAHTKLAKSKNPFEHVLGESILPVALGQTIAFCEAKMLCLRPGAHQSSKVAFSKIAFSQSKFAFGKSAFARTNLLLDGACLLLPKANAF